MIYIKSNYLQISQYFISLFIYYKNFKIYNVTVITFNLKEIKKAIEIKYEWFLAVLIDLTVQAWDTFMLLFGLRIATTEINK